MISRSGLDMMRSGVANAIMSLIFSIDIFAAYFTRVRPEKQLVSRFV